jgi:colicin import membrane protein
VKSPAEAHERPRQPGKIRSILLALAVHVGFFALIVFGVSWQSRPTPPLQAELWDKLPPSVPAAVPRPDPPAPKEQPPADPPKVDPPKVDPKPDPRPLPPKADPKPEPPRPDPAIAERKEKEKKQREKQERERKEKQEQERRDQEKKAQEKKERETKAAAEAKAAADAKAKAAADARAKAKADADAKAAADALATARESEIKGFIDRIRAKIRGKANVPDTVSGAPEVQVRITILPGGDVLDIVIVKSSGNRVYDTAIERAIRSAQPLPVPTSPELFGQFRSLTLNIRHER